MCACVRACVCVCVCVCVVFVVVGFFPLRIQQMPETKQLWLRAEKKHGETEVEDGIYTAMTTRARTSPRKDLNGSAML